MLAITAAGHHPGGANARSDPVTLLEHPLPRWGKELARLPLLLYRVRLGGLLGHRFLVIVHRGRRSVRLYRTVVEVVRWDAAQQEAVVATGWGEQSSWLRNLRAEPAVEIWLAGERFAATQRFLGPEERLEALRGYAREHPHATRLLGPLLGVGDEGSLAAAAERLPMVAFGLRRRALEHQPRYLTAAQARQTYDRVGRVQDVQAVYEHRATSELLAHADFEHAQAVFELGYGTAAFAQRVLDRHLPPDSRYVGVDVSPRMRRLATRRLRRYEQRSTLSLSDGSFAFPYESGTFDRFVANYVFDLLSPAAIELALGEAYRLLEPGGLLCVTSLTFGATPPARVLTRVWKALWAFQPELVGGCRPIRLDEHLDPAAWTRRYHAVVTTLAVSSDVLVAERARDGGASQGSAPSA
jgi:deazaflavin-dependent oxidoreductase (nitroreductase family)